MIYFFQSFSELGLSLGIWREDPLPVGYYRQKFYTFKVYHEREE